MSHDIRIIICLTSTPQTTTYDRNLLLEEARFHGYEKLNLPSTTIASCRHIPMLYYNHSRFCYANSAKDLRLSDDGHTFPFLYFGNMVPCLVVVCFYNIHNIRFDTCRSNQ